MNIIEAVKELLNNGSNRLRNPNWKSNIYVQYNSVTGLCVYNAKNNWIKPWSPRYYDFVCDNFIIVNVYSIDAELASQKDTAIDNELSSQTDTTVDNELPLVVDYNDCNSNNKHYNDLYKFFDIINSNFKKVFNK